jgi:uncharacterized glyoxalase superfamily protein PhnB
MTDVRCVLAVNDLAASLAFYRDKLGFGIDFEAPGWAFISRDRFRVALGDCADATPAAELGDHSYFVYVTVEEVDELFRELAAKGVETFNGPIDKPWGMREFGIRTPDGHRIMFGQPL